MKTPSEEEFDKQQDRYEVRITPEAIAEHRKAIKKWNEDFEEWKRQVSITGKLLGLVLKYREVSYPESTQESTQESTSDYHPEETPEGSKE